MNDRLKRWTLGLLLIVGIISLTMMPQPFPKHLAKVDFQAYWGASYLLAHSQNSSDPALLYELQKQHAGLEEESAQMAWNPPWLLVLLIPLTYLPFEQASWIWFLTSFGLIGISTMLISQLLTSEENRLRLTAFGLAISFVFIPTLTTLLVGQVSSLVLFGLAAFLFLEERRKPFLAGAALALTTIKPHLVYLTLPLLLLELLVNRRWRTLAGFAALLAAGTGTALLLRPAFFSEYLATVGSGSLMQRTVPTLGYYLSTVFDFPEARLMGAAVLPLALLIWQFQRTRSPISLTSLLLFSLPISIVTAPFGWSFDAIILLLPLMQLTAWILERQIGRIESAAILLIFAGANALVFYRRSVDMQDAQFFWFPMVLACLYLWGWHRAAGSRLRSPAGAAQTAASHRASSAP